MTSPSLVDDTVPATWPARLLWHTRQLLRSPRDHWPRLAATGPGPLGRVGPWLGALLLAQAVAVLVRAPLRDAIGLLVQGLLATLLGLSLGTLLAWFWAPRFGGDRAAGRAGRLTLHAAWPAALAGLLAALLAFASHGLAMVVHLAGAAASIYQLRQGLPPMLQVPQAKAWRCTAAIVASAVLLMLLMMLSRCAITAGGQAGPMDGAPTAATAGTPTPRSPGNPHRARTDDDGGKGSGTGALVIDPDAARGAWERGMAAASAAMAQGGPRMAPPVAGSLQLNPSVPSQLAELLPETLCGLSRSSLTSRLLRNPPTPQGVPQDYAEALADYRGPRGTPGPVLHLTIADRTPAAGVFISLKQSGVMGTQNERRTARGWMRMHLEGNTLVEERWDEARREDAMYALVAERYLVSAVVDQAASPQCASQAARAVDWRRLEAWAAEPSK